jgi:hypothetical protein
LAGDGTWQPILSQNGRLREYSTRLVRFDSQRLRPGYFAYAVRLAAAMNPARTSTFTSKPFRVLPHVVRARHGRYHASKRGVAQPG